MSAFTGNELQYLLSDRRLARLATVGRDGTPHVAPVGWSYNAGLDAVEVRGRALEKSKKFRDVRRTGRAALVVDDVLPPWSPRGVEVRGRAEAVEEPEPLIRIHPDRIVSWGIESDAIGERSSRAVRPRHAPAAG